MNGREGQIKVDTRNKKRKGTKGRRYIRINIKNAEDKNRVDCSGRNESLETGNSFKEGNDSEEITT